MAVLPRRPNIQMNAVEPCIACSPIKHGMTNQVEFVVATWPRYPSDGLLNRRVCSFRPIRLKLNMSRMETLMNSLLRTLLSSSQLVLSGSGRTGVPTCSG